MLLANVVSNIDATITNSFAQKHLHIAENESSQLGIFDSHVKKYLKILLGTKFKSNFSDCLYVITNPFSSQSNIFESWLLLMISVNQSNVSRINNSLSNKEKLCLS